MTNSSPVKIPTLSFWLAHRIVYTTNCPFVIESIYLKLAIFFIFVLSNFILNLSDRKKSFLKKIGKL